MIRCHEVLSVQLPTVCEACQQQVRGMTSPDPQALLSLWIWAQVSIRSLGENTLSAPWEGPYEGLLTTCTAVQGKGKASCLHAGRSKYTQVITPTPLEAVPAGDLTPGTARATGLAPEQMAPQCDSSPKVTSRETWLSLVS